MTNEKKKLIFAVIKKILIIIAFLGAVAGGVYGIMCALGVNTIDKLQEIANNNGFWIYPLITILQVVQVVFLPVSNQVITLVALPVLGILPTFICSYIGIQIGTICLYLIGRFSGGKLLKWILGDQQTVDKFTHIIKTRRLFYICAMICPFIPADICTTIMGLTKQNFVYVLIVSAITRAVNIAFTCFGFGYLIFTWYGIVIMVVGLCLLAFMAYATLRYGDRFEKWFFGIFKKKNNKTIENDLTNEQESSIIKESEESASNSQEK